MNDEHNTGKYDKIRLAMTHWVTMEISQLTWFGLIDELNVKVIHLLSHLCQTASRRCYEGMIGWRAGSAILATRQPAGGY